MLKQNINHQKEVSDNNWYRGIDLDPLINQEPGVVYQQDASYGFLNVEITDQGSVLIGKYYSNDGNVLDEFKIIK
jgi:hypothetical protein